MINRLVLSAGNFVDSAAHVSGISTVSIESTSVIPASEKVYDLIPSLDEIQFDNSIVYDFWDDWLQLCLVKKKSGSDTAGLLFRNRSQPSYDFLSVVKHLLINCG